MVKKQKSKISWIRMILVVLGVILISIVISIATSYFKTKSVVKNLPAISTVDARDYKLSDKELYRGELKICTDWSNQLYGWCMRSSFFPYSKLEKQIVRSGNPIINSIDGKLIDKSTETRYLLHDRRWSIYWIYSQTGYGPEKYYGPFQESL